MTQCLDFEINALSLRRYYSVQEVQHLRTRMHAVCHTVKTRQVVHTVWRQGGWWDRSSSLKHYNAEELANACMLKLEKVKVKEPWLKILRGIKKEAVRNLRIASAT